MEGIRSIFLRHVISWLIKFMACIKCKSCIFINLDPSAGGTDGGIFRRALCGCKGACERLEPRKAADGGEEAR